MDGDVGSFGELEFSLSPEDSGKPFNVTTIPGGFGNIYTTQPLDYEQAVNYTLTVIVEDLAANVLDRR